MASDDGLHDGWLAPVFRDGQRGYGVIGGGIPHDHIAVGPEVQAPDGTWQYPSRSAAEVTSWIVVCDSGSVSGSTSTWIGPDFIRVPSAALENLHERRIYAIDDDVVDVFHRDDLQVVVADLWRSEHLFTVGTLDDVAAAAVTLNAARARLDKAVAMARLGGASWADIGRATGITRQSAQERWRTTSPGPQFLGRGVPTRRRWVVEPRPATSASLDDAPSRDSRPSSSRRQNVVRSGVAKVASSTSKSSWMVSVRTSILGRPRPLSRHRRADRSLDHCPEDYTLNREEPVKVSRASRAHRTRDSRFRVGRIGAASGRA